MVSAGQQVWQSRDVAGAIGLDEPITAGRDAPVREHVRAGLDVRLRAMVRHDPGTRLGEDPEELHQMRVSVRRMRAMLRSGRPFLDQDWSEPLRAELGWLGRALGPVRDLDVLIDRLRQETADLDAEERAAAARLLSGLEVEHGEARFELLAALDSDRYMTLVQSLAAAVRSELPGSDLDGPDELRRLVDKEYRKLRKAVGKLGDDPSDEELHALRIRGKRLRYTAELAESALDVKPLLKAAKRFQDVLGEHQDACVAGQRLRDLLRALGDGADGTVAFVAGRLVEREEARRRDRRAEWPAAWQDLSNAA
ncbi:CHAD domain-containing protein [Saccharopolyspora erythraea NRRL 2338]|uniref:CHAD domain containing protein n=2 Tax=Saccharopolyspora erythraea TaxID=1836 RepID=A4F8G9_SACEN|nr:CHAD domain-containing protein [Saccharopolyspora erythraea]EQD82334.1 metal-chelation protein CHAD [Saccharopolyspora erythraea D]PFG94139.1 CHAD domain-containing protein [Saccharopolyspora erythraea NRRL 2338]QRK90927.1 CHAD domain-containing protein [Saccharopolyspora erythraea]CAM00344.1 CHAD domain containing protein [Saccharopolyspora erythraea NRRL 2338]